MVKLEAKRLGTERVMRVDSIISLVLFLAGLAASPAPSQDAAGPGSHPTIISVSFAEHPDSTDVEVTFSKLVQADVSTLEHPDGLVFDLPECELAHPGQRLVVNRGSVFAVRTAVFRSAPPIAIAGASLVTQSVWSQETMQAKPTDIHAFRWGWTAFMLLTRRFLI